jgi:N-acetyltransferase 10
LTCTNIRYTYYRDSHKVLGQTFGTVVLQDFEALTPNLLARTIETVEGGGLVIFLLKTMTSLQQLYSMSMDVHSRYRTESHQDVVGRFNERFLLSIGACKRCLVLDDELNILPISSAAKTIQPLAAPKEDEDAVLTPAEQSLAELRESLRDTMPVGALVGAAKTFDQAKAVLEFVDAVSDKVCHYLSL